MFQKIKFTVFVSLCAFEFGCTEAEVAQSSAGADAPSAVAEGSDDRAAMLTGLFAQDAFVQEPRIVDCTLSGGTKTQCLSISVGTSPVDFTPGPWCPRNIADGADKGGIWLKDGVVHDVDGQFVENLATFYNDDVWQMFDAESGDINVTDTKEECAAAARPDVDPAYYNYCVQCLPSYMDEDASMTYVLPLEPVKASHQGDTRGSGVGLSFSGARYDGPAPVDAILDAHTLAPFDDCGGHVNLHAGYHIHAVNGCTHEHKDGSGHAPMIGLAMDGYPLYAQKNEDGQEPDDLDACRGHEIEGLGYHYHVADAGENEILPCFTGELGCSSEDVDTVCDASASPARPPRGGGGRGGRPDGPPPPR